MTVVVFLRGVNVGGHKVFRPAELARRLHRLEVTNIGAAGTFIVRRAASEAAARTAFVKELPFNAEVMTCTARELAALVAADPCVRQANDPTVTRYVSMLGARPRRLPVLPVRAPDSGTAWQISIVDIQSRFATSLQRRDIKVTVSLNDVIEKRLGVSATTRNWNTIVRVNDALANP